MTIMTLEGRSDCLLLARVRTLYLSAVTEGACRAELTLIQDSVRTALVIMHFPSRCNVSRWERSVITNVFKTAPEKGIIMIH